MAFGRLLEKLKNRAHIIIVEFLFIFIFMIILPHLGEEYPHS